MVRRTVWTIRQASAPRQGKYARPANKGVDNRIKRGGGGGGADGVYATHVCPCATTRVQLFYWTSASALVPSAGLTSWRPLRLSLRMQVPGVPGPNPKARKKIARHAHLTPHSSSGKGAPSFPYPRRWMPRIQNERRRCSWPCLPGCGGGGGGGGGGTDDDVSDDTDAEDAPNSGDHVPVDMTPLALHQCAGP